VRESQVPNRPGLAERSHGESNRSGCRPTANAGPFSQEAMPRILRRREVVILSRWGDANESGGLQDLPPTGEVALTSLATPSLQQVNLFTLLTFGIPRRAAWD
jgi:hypothetical protein